MIDGNCGPTLGKEASRTGKVTSAKILEWLNQQGYRCALTGWELTPDNASLDHIEPLSGGGSHGMENVQILASKVNQAKGTMSQEEFVAMCKAVASHAG